MGDPSPVDVCTAALLASAERILRAGGMPPELVGAVIVAARAGASLPSSVDRRGALKAADRREHEELWSVRDLARYLGVHERTIVRHIEAGRLASTRVGRQHRFRQPDIDRYLSSSQCAVQSIARGDRAA